MKVRPYATNTIYPVIRMLMTMLSVNSDGYDLALFERFQLEQFNKLRGRINGCSEYFQKQEDHFKVHALRTYASRAMVDLTYTISITIKFVP